MSEHRAGPVAVVIRRCSECHGLLWREPLWTWTHDRCEETRSARVRATVHPAARA